MNFFPIFEIFWNFGNFRNFWNFWKFSKLLKFSKFLKIKYHWHTYYFFPLVIRLLVDSLILLNLGPIFNLVLLLGFTLILVPISVTTSSDAIFQRYCSKNFFKAPNQKLEFSEKNLSQNRLFFHLNDRQKSVFWTSKLEKKIFSYFGQYDCSLICWPSLAEIWAPWEHFARTSTLRKLNF